MLAHARPNRRVRIYFKRDDRSNRQGHADGDGFAMQQGVTESGLGFKRMREGMAQIEQSPLAAFLFILGNDSGLHPAAFRYRMDTRLLVAGQ